MRPIPEPRHWIAAVVLVLAAAFAAYFAWADWRVSDEQLRSLTALEASRDANLFPHDLAFGASGAWRFESPCFQAILERLVRFGGEPLTPFRLLAGVAAAIFLAGMYVLLYLQTRSWSVSTFVAVLSMTVIHSLGGGFWGVGSLSSITPSGLVMAFTPFLVLAYLRLQNYWQVVLVFGVLGLLANVHVPSAGNLALVLLLVHLGQRRFHLRAWLTALACGGTALLFAGPILWHRWQLAMRLRPAGSMVLWSAARHAAKLAEWEALYPRLIDGVWTWLFFIVVLLIISAVILSKGERFHIRSFALWVWWILGAIIVAFGFQGGAQVWGSAFSRPATVGYSQASALVFLPLYVLLAQAVTTLFRVISSHRALARWGCAVFLALWLVPSDNLRAPRYAATDLITMFMKEENKPAYVRKHHDGFHRWREMQNIAAWLRDNAPRGAMLISESTELRYHSRRSLLAARDDVDSLYRFAPWTLEEWWKTLDSQRRALDAGSRQGLDSLADDGAERAPNDPWFVVLRPSDQAARDLPKIAPQGWGQYYVLCRIR